MKIDAHQHFWHYSDQEYGWIDHTMEKLKKDFLPDDLYPLMKDSGIDGSITVQARQKVEETRWLLKLSEQNDFIKGVVGWVDLRHKNLSSQLEQFNQHPKFVGVRHVVQDEPDDHFMLGKEFLAGIAELSHYNLVYEILIYHRHLPVAIKFVERFPEQRFVLDHIGKPNIRDGILDPWREHIQRLAEFPNVYCKISGMITETDWHNWKTSDFRPYLDTVFGCFGIQRVLMGSDWPVCTLAGGYNQVFKIVLNHIKSFSQEERSMIMGKNACDVYKITVE